MIENKDQHQNAYDDGNIPKVDTLSAKETQPTTPKPETERPRKDGPGGE